jgi:hypothetical protein
MIRSRSVALKGAEMLKALVSIVIAALAALVSPVGVGTAQAQSDPPERTFLMSPTGLNLVDTTFVQNVTDFSIGTLAFGRSYISSNPYSSEYFGKGWTSNLDITAHYSIVSGNARTIVVIGRQTHSFAGQPSLNYPENFDLGTKVTIVGTSMIFTDRDGTVYTFVPTGSNVNFQTISSIAYTNGTVINFAYVSGKPKTIVNNLGYGVVLDYTGGYVSAACGFNLSVNYITTSTTCVGAALKTSYTYTTAVGKTLLATATDVSGNVTNYSYGTNSLANDAGLLICAKDPGSATCAIANTYRATFNLKGKPVIASQTMADGSVWQFDCSCGDNAYGDGDPDDLNPPPETTTMTKPGGSSTTTSFNVGSKSLPLPAVAVSFTDEIGRTFPINYDELPHSMALPEGNIYQWQYTINGQVLSGRTLKAKPGSGLPDIAVEARTFPTTGCTTTVFTSLSCNLPLTSTDAKGNTTTYTYDYAHGGVLTETKPADSNGVHPVIRNTYGQRYAWIKNSGGAYSQAVSPVWLLLETRTCASSATVGNACSAGSADEIVTSYDYGPDSGPNNLSLRGTVVTANVPGAPTNPVSRRTCYGYDWRGNKISQTSPRGTVCP